MVTYNWIKLREHPELVKQSANWFSSKWGVPAVVYEESIRTGIASKESIPQWYVVLDEKETIVGGAGVIEKRKQGIAKRILAEIRKEMHQLGYEKLYLITDHTTFYERYEWTFLTMVKEESGTTARLYQSDTIG